MLQTLMFKACLARAGQLHAKDLRIEAESMMKLATNFMPSAEDITGKELQTCIAQAPLAQSIKIYSAWLSVHPPCPVCEIKLADRLVETRQWERMESLPQTCGLKANIERIQKAVSEMDRGEWENALTTLKPVPSQSPFAPLRLFCRGMTAFLANDDTRMQKAFSLIPPGFSLMPVIERMRQPLNVLLTGLEEQDTAILNCLWEEPLKKEPYISDLFQNVRQQHVPELKATIIGLAERICPQDPVSVKFFVLKQMWLALIIQRDFSPEVLFNLVYDLLPRNAAGLLKDHLRLLSGVAPFSTSGVNILSLDQIFKEKAQQSMAKSLILFKLVERTSKNTMEWFDRDRTGLEKFHALFGISTKHLEQNDREMILLDIAAEALRLDPDNKEGCRQIARLKLRTRAAKTMLEALLQTMAERFVNDPWPCLELASRYYGKNAFRKAEAVLFEAMRRAPHDRHVLERYVIALLISIGNNLRRRKYNPAWKDLERAEKYSSPGTAFLIAEKKILLQMLDRQRSLEDTLEEDLRPFETADQLKIMALLDLEMQNSKLDFPGSIPKKLKARIVRSLNRIKHLPSREIIQLLLPIPKEYAPLTGSGFLFSKTAIKKYKVLSYLEHEDFARILEYMIDEALFPVIQQEIRKRLKSDLPSEVRIRLEFYQIKR
jgi:hypothetical protein